MKDLAADEIHVMRHALGIQFRGRKWSAPYRNHFCASAGSDDDRLWQSLCEQGLAERIQPLPDGAAEPFATYRVTDSGKAALPAPSVAKRSKRSAV